jgi:hypothetical protein
MRRVRPSIPRLASVVTAALLALAPFAARADDAPTLRSALASAIDPNPTRNTPRLARVDIDPMGDATVMFAIQNAEDDADAVRAGALADALALLQAAYSSPDAEHITSVTVLGTFPFKSTKGKSVREAPVLRAVLSAQHAASLTWDDVTPDALDDWWLQGAFADALGAAEANAPVE